MAFIEFLENFTDIGLDGLSFYEYYFGTNYTKFVSDITDTTVTNPDFNCTLISTNHYWTGENETCYEFTCFEKDPVFGVLSLALMPIVGFIWAMTQ